MSEQEAEKQETKVDEITVDYTSHWKKYYENIAAERMKEVTKFAKQHSFKIKILDEEEGVWKEKTFKYFEISTKKWMELEELRSQYNDLEKIAASKVLSVKDNSYDYTQQLNKLLAEIYKKSAFYFLRMTEEEFDNSRWTDIKMVIDACNHRTIFTLPN